MNANGQGFIRKAMRAFGAGAPLQLATDELFAIRPGAAVSPTVAYGGMGAQPAEPQKPYRMLPGGIAEIPVVGVLSKYPSIFRMFGCSDQPTLGELAHLVRLAANDGEVAGLMLYVDSPGGTVAGTAELADEIAEAAKSKPVHAFAQDCCASAAYWIACQADQLTASRTADVGGIGIFAILLDASKAADMAGLKFQVIASGEFKGAGIEPGAGISDSQLAYFRQRVQDTAEYFFAAVAAGRGMAADQVLELADGRCFIAAKAAALGLADGVGSYEAAVAGLLAAIEAPSEPEVEEPPAQPRDDSGRFAPWELPGDEPTDAPAPMPDGPNEEAAMANDKPAPKPNQTPPQGADEEKRGLLATLARMLGTSTAAPAEPVAVATPAPPVAPVQPPAGMTAEQVDQRIAAALAEQVVTNDLAPLQGKATPAAINALRPEMVKAKAEGRNDAYKAMLTSLGASDATAMLGGPVAGEAQTAGAVAGLLCNQREAALIAANPILVDGKPVRMTAEDIARIEQKYLRAN